MAKVGQSLGRSNFYIFRTLVIPAMLPGIAAAFALVFLNLMKELTATLLLTPMTLKHFQPRCGNIPLMHNMRQQRLMPLC